MLAKLLLLLYALAAFAYPEKGPAEKVIAAIGRLQTVGIRGRLLCGSEPLTNTTLKLWEEDPGLDPDDLMSETVTDDEGRFIIYGSQTEITDIEAKLKIYHDCDNKNEGCKRKVTFDIPEQFVARGPDVTKWLEFGSLNMELIHKHEGKHCP